MKKFVYFGAGILAAITILIGSITPLPALAQNDIAIISDLDWNSDGSLIAIGISNPFRVPTLPNSESMCTTSPDIHLLDVKSLQLTSIPNDKMCSVTNVDFSPDGLRLLTTSDSDLEIWDVNTGQGLQGVFMFSLFQHALWHPDGESLLAVRSTGIEVTSADDLTEPFLVFLAPNRAAGIGFTYSVWSPDGNSIASSTNNGEIYIWDASNETILQVFTMHTASVQKLVWNSATGLIASGDDSGKILVWNPATGEIVAQLNGHTGAIRDLDWRLDGQQLASAGADNTVRTWAWPSGQMQIVEHGKSIWSVAYSPDGSQLAYGGELRDSQDIAAHIEIISVAPAPTHLQSAVYMLLRYAFFMWAHCYAPLE